jgi:hypothetical protein
VIGTIKKEEGDQRERKRGGEQEMVQVKADMIQA